MNNFYNINFSELKTLMLPTFWRRPTLTALLEAFLTPLINLYIRFLEFKADTDYKQSITSQVVYMEKMLNDAYDPIARRIFIQNAQRIQPVWFYEPEDELPVFFYEEGERPVYFYEPEDFAIYSPDFTVHIPEAIRPPTQGEEDTFITALRGKVDYFKIYSKNYNTVFYE